MVNLLKINIKKAIKDIRRRLWFLNFYGNEFICICCAASLKRFDGQKCPKCDSMRRHRVIFKYMSDHPQLFKTSGRLKLLHFAPETFFRIFFSKMKSVEYYDADINPHAAKFQVDITDIKYPEGYFDAILCVHVLEHVTNDALAMRELYRVLKKGGWAIIQSPLDFNRSETYEDPAVVTPAQRLKIYGDFDHRRIYGMDYGKKLNAAGFDVCLDPYVSNLSELFIKRYGLRREDIYFCRKK